MYFQNDHEEGELPQEEVLEDEDPVLAFEAETDSDSNSEPDSKGASEPSTSPPPSEAAAEGSGMKKQTPSEAVPMNEGSGIKKPRIISAGPYHQPSAAVKAQGQLSSNVVQFTKKILQVKPSPSPAPSQNSAAISESSGKRIISSVSNNQPRSLITIEDEFSLYGQQIAMKMRKLESPLARFRVQGAIHRVLFDAEMGRYD